MDIGEINIFSVFFFCVLTFPPEMVLSDTLAY